MKNTVLAPTDKVLVQAIALCMMACNDRNDDNASDRNECGTYGLLHRAISALVFNQTGVDIENGVDWNLGGNATWADDIQQAINDKLASEARQAEQARLDREFDTKCRMADHELGA